MAKTVKVFAQMTYDMGLPLCDGTAEVYKVDASLTDKEIEIRIHEHLFMYDKGYQPDCMFWEKIDIIDIN